MSKVPQAERVGVAVLGSTGSVGRQALAVIDALSGAFRVVSLAARSFSRPLAEQIARYKPEFVAVSEGAAELPGKEPRVAVGPESLVMAAIHPAVDIVLVATSGHAAIPPTVQAIKHGKTIALANKETLVCAGELIMPLAAAHGAEIRPVDSEHSAIWQAVSGTPTERVRRIVITASGGPFRTSPRDAFAEITAQQALSHPTWTMGGKITVDSATMMNKGLEVIEAHWLFGLPYEQIDVLVHPESIVHSLVEFVDGAFIAQLGLPDMKLPIQYALTYPNREPMAGDRLDLVQVAALHFEHPDTTRFPSLRIAREAGVAGRTFPTALSAADEEAVAAFLGGALRFVEIPEVVASVLDMHDPDAVSLETIAETDRWARNAARELIRQKARD